MLVSRRFSLQNLTPASRAAEASSAAQSTVMSPMTISEVPIKESPKTCLVLNQHSHGAEEHQIHTIRITWDYFTLKSSSSPWRIRQCQGHRVTQNWSDFRKEEENIFLCNDH